MRLIQTFATTAVAYLVAAVLATAFGLNITDYPPFTFDMDVQTLPFLGDTLTQLQSQYTVVVNGGTPHISSIGF